MQDADYTEEQRQSVEGRWTLWRVRERDGAQRFGRWWHVDPQPVPEDTPEFVAEMMPVVPCDDAAVKRVAAALDDGRVFPGDESEITKEELRELAVLALRAAAGEDGSAGA